MKISKIIAVGAACVSLAVEAKTDSHFTNSSGADIAYNSKGDIVRGEWTSQFEKAMKQAKSEGVPIVIFWANNGCSHCAATEVQLCTDTFKKWQEKQQLYMVFCCGGYSGPCGDEAAEARAASRDSSGEFPYIAAYWSQKKSSYVGTTNWKDIKPLGTMTGNGKSADAIISKVNELISGYSPCVGGWFTFGSDVTDKVDDTKKLMHHYEADLAKTTKVTLQLKRSTKNLAAGTDKMVVYKTDGKTVLKTYTVSWAKNAKTMDVAVSVKDVFTKAGQNIKVVMNGKTEKKYIAYIYSVKRVNSASNPDFKGFKAGNWTMDLDAAKAYAKANESYTLVSMQGSLWCHDCANTDRNFLDVTDADGKNEFVAWAKEKKVALVTVDIPNFTGAKYSNFSSPCLLSTKQYSSHLAYEGVYGFYDVSKAGAPKALNADIMRSGLAYLSRNMVSDTDALAKLKVFHDLAYKNTDKGGFHRYFVDKTEDGNEFRTGVPIFVLLDKNGQPVARFTDFASTSPVKADKAKFADYLKRFDEMLAIADNKVGLDEGEVKLANNRVGSGSIDLSFDSVASNRLCAADRMDTFLLTKDGSVRGSVQLKAADEVSVGATVAVQFWQEADGVDAPCGEPVNVTLGSDYGLAITNGFEGAGKCYVKVSAAFAGADTRVGNFIAYEIASAIDSVMPLDTKVTVTAEKLSMAVVSGQVYRLSGVKDPTELGFIPANAEGLYRWNQADGKVMLMADEGGEISYQKWNPGTISFKTATGSMKKKVTTKKVSVVREGGVSGKVGVKIRLDVDNTDFYYDINAGTKEEPRFDLPDANEDGVIELFWDEGDDAVKTVSIAIETKSEVDKWYGDGKICLACQPNGEGCDAVAEIGEVGNYVLTVTEPGDPTMSTVSLAGIAPAPTYGTTVYARRSSVVELTLARSQDGTTDKGSVLMQSDGTVKFSGDAVTDDAKVNWGVRDYAPKTVAVTKLPKVGKSVTVSVGKVKKSFEVDTSGSAYTIISVDNGAPEFEKSKLSTIKTVRYTPVSEKVAFVTTPETTGTLGFEIIKGELPSGVSAKVSDGYLKISGTVKAKAGTYKVYFRATETRGSGKSAKVIEGLPLYVAFKVVDPVTVKSTDETYGHLVNTAIKSARTLSDIPVYADVDEIRRLWGTVTVTIPATGKVSAKYSASNRSKAVSFSAKRWEKKNMADPDGTLTAKLTSTDDAYAMELDARPDGVVVIRLHDKRLKESDPKKPGFWLTVESYGKVWSSSNTAKKYRGKYTVTMIESEIYDADSDKFSAPRGNGYVCLTMTSKTDYNAGTMKWAGKLPNGADFSGSAVLSMGKTKVFGRSNYAYLPIVAKSEADDDGNYDRLAIVLAVKKGAADSDGAIVKAVYGDPELEETLPIGLWSHVGGTKAAETSYEADLVAYGSYYDSSRTLTDCCGGATKQKFHFGLPEFVVYPGVPEAIGDINISVKSSSLSVAGNEIDFVIDNMGKPNSAGVISGTFKLPYLKNGKEKTVKATWAGVVLPGWSFCNCGEGPQELDLPFITGSYWFKDTVPYQAGGREKSVAEFGGAAIDALKR